LPIGQYSLIHEDESAAAVMRVVATITVAICSYCGLVMHHCRTIGETVGPTRRVTVLSVVKIRSWDNSDSFEYSASIDCRDIFGVGIPYISSRLRTRRGLLYAKRPVTDRMTSGVANHAGV